MGKSSSSAVLFKSENKVLIRFGEKNRLEKIKENGKICIQ